MDIVTEVFAAGLLSIMAGIIALLNGAYVVAASSFGNQHYCNYIVDGICSSCLLNVRSRFRKY